ncbi:hypothetical protein T07_8699 [Trichinella nelsoni]|uniref:F-box domain-containing protein n=1 Tax=Trichinella nelsoni TaxID=6336 RepID=A0A0V0RST8_9BILA|nr:hypothetical protein T07_8699 [Trichinella nelsoni]
MTSSHSPDIYKMLQTEEMQHLELDDAYRCNWGIWFNIFRLMRTEDIMRLAYASREINAMAQSYFNYKMLQTEEMQHLELDDAYRCNWGIWFNIFRLMRTEDIMRLAYASREINAMAQSYFNDFLISDDLIKRIFLRQDFASALGLVGQTNPVSEQSLQYSVASRRLGSPALTGLGNEECADSDQVAVVVGIDSYYRFLRNKIRRGGAKDPVAVESVLGWIIYSPVTASHPSSIRTTLCASVDQSIDRTLRRFWEIEEVRAGSHEEPELSEQEQSFRDRHSFDGSRYSVRMFKNNGELNLLNNVESALRRLGAVEVRLARDPA